MKLAICAQEKDLEAKTDERFGRCAYFVIVDPDQNVLIASIDNSSADAAGGAGPQAVQLLVQHDVEALVLGNVGPNASAALEAAKIAVYSGMGKTVAETMDKYKSGELEKVSGSTVPPHSGKS